MKPLTIIYIIIYILHIVLGPYFIYSLIYYKKLKYKSKSLTQILKRCVWITYVALLFIAYFNEYPDTDTFYAALIISVSATLGYYLKFYESKYFRLGITEHIVLLLLPVFILYFKYGIDLNIYNISKSTLIAIIFVFLSFYMDQYIYIGGRDVSFI